MEIKGLPESVEIPKAARKRQREEGGAEREGGEHWRGRERRDGGV